MVTGKYLTSRVAIRSERRKLNSVKLNMNLKIRTFAVSLAAYLAFATGCSEKSTVEKAEDKARSATQEAGDAIADAAKKTGKAIEENAQKAWDKTKEGAQKVSQAATNVAIDIKEGAKAFGEKIEGVVK